MELDASAAAERAVVALREPGRNGKILAVVLRNMDGAHGRRLLQMARLPQDLWNPVHGGSKMAAVREATPLTSPAAHYRHVGPCSLVRSPAAPAR